MRLPTHTTPLRSLAFGLASLLSVSANLLINFNSASNAQSFPNDSVTVTPVSAGAQYLVYLPNVANVKQAKVLAPDAFISRLDTGEQVVQLGRFNNLNLAQRRAAQFSQAGLAPQIKTVQSKFATVPSNTVQPITPTSSAPIPVESVPIQTTRPDALPNVPGSELPNNQSNAIEIVRSPQPVSQQSQPIPIQNASQPIASQGIVNTSQLRYFVIIPTGQTSELQRVQAIAPSAQLRSSYRGTYIEVQGYPDRPSAETLNLTIRRQGFDSRVVFF